MTSPSFVHLRVHSEYSLADSVIRLKPLTAAVAAAGMPAIALTDQSNLFALVKFYRAAQNTGLKPIIGADCCLLNESEPTKPFHLTLLAQNQTGYRHLTQLLSKAYREGQQHGQPMLTRAWLQQANQGLIVLSGGREGDVGQALLTGHLPQARSLLAEWLRFFGDRYYLEVSRTGRELEEDCLHLSIDLALQQGVPVVATNDVRFLTPDDFDTHEIRVCIYQGRTLEDPQRPRLYSEQQYLRSPEEMAKRFADLPEALENTVEIAKRCNLELSLGQNFLPDFPIPAGISMHDYFVAEAQKGLEQRFAQRFAADDTAIAEQRQHYQARLQLELDVIIQMGFPGYFLIVADFIQWAKDHQIPVGPGRGSGAGSLVAYALKITDLDPIEHNLLFERFLNPERVSMPDFDVDFCMDQRDRVIDYVAERYGRDAVSQIITYGSMAAKAVVRDVGRVLGHPYGFVDGIAKQIPFEVGMTLEKALSQSDDLRQRYEREDEVRELLEMARKLEGLARNVGKHAGGVVIAPTVLTDFTPLYCEPSGDNLVTQLDKDDVEAVGLVKFDFLGLRTLTIIDWALQTINRQRAIQELSPIDISAIPLDDPEAFKVLKRAETTAVFQLESRGMKELIKKLQPDSFADMTALVALYRPGPLQSGMVDDFIDRKHGRAEVVYPHPKLEPILKPTYGVILYQEQVMQIAQVLAGYTLGGADILRRCLSGATRIQLANEEQVSLATIAKDPVAWIGHEVFALDEATQQITVCPIEAVYHNGFRQVWEVTTQTQSRIRATLDHQFYGLKGWQALQQFQPGDLIGLAKHLAKAEEGEIVWDRVVTIKPGRIEAVYDLTIAQAHNFIAEDYIVHNCMGKKKPEEMAKQGEIFLQGSADNDVAEEVAKSIFDLMEKFAGYGFNLSHSAAYALVSYQTLWLKTHYPAAFMAAVLSSDMDNTEKVVTLINECRSMKLKIAPPNINQSDTRFTAVDDRQIFYGLAAIKGVGEAAIDDILAARKQGDFADLFDFCQRVDLRRVNRRVMEALIMAGALDVLENNRALLLAQLPFALKMAEQYGATKAVGQNDLFGINEKSSASTGHSLARSTVPDPNWDDVRQLQGEKETLGFFLTGHPIDRYHHELEHVVTAPLAQLRLQQRSPREKQQVTVAGIVVSIRKHLSQRGQMCSLVLEDQQTRLETTFFADAYSQYRDLLVPERIQDQLLVVGGSLAFDQFRGGLSLRAEQALTIEQIRVQRAKWLLLTLDGTQLKTAQSIKTLLSNLQTLLTTHRGNCPIRICYQRQDGEAQFRLAAEWNIHPNDELLRQCNRTSALSAQILYP